MNYRLMIAALVVLLTAKIAVADETLTKFSCGKSSITLYNGNIAESPFFVITVWNGVSKEYYTFEVDNEYLDVRCEKDSKGKYFLLVNHFCGGSGCAESNYALIDLVRNIKVLNAFERHKGNASEASSKLGQPVKPFSCNKRSKGAATPNDKGEFCVVSPIELD